MLRKARWVTLLITVVISIATIVQAQPPASAVPALQAPRPLVVGASATQISRSPATTLADRLKAIRGQEADASSGQSSSTGNAR